MGAVLNQGRMRWASKGLNVQPGGLSSACTPAMPIPALCISSPGCARKLAPVGVSKVPIQQRGDKQEGPVGSVCWSLWE